MTTTVSHVPTAISEARPGVQAEALLVVCLGISTVFSRIVAVVAAALTITDQQRVELGRMAASSVLAYRQVVQAQALLWAADGDRE